MNNEVAGNAPIRDTVDVYVQSNTSNLFRAFLQTHEKEDITLTSDIAIDDMTINVSTGHGISIGDSLIIYNPYYYWQSLVTNVVSDAITLEDPAGLIFSTTDTIIIRGSRDLNVASNSTFQFGLHSQFIPPVDITKIILFMGHSAQGDYSKFGGISALTNGLLVRREGNILFNLGVYKTNIDFRLVGGDVKFPDNAPAGTYGTDVEINLQGQENYDQVIRIRYGDHFNAYTRDPLDTLDFFQIALIGSYTSGE